MLGIDIMGATPTAILFVLSFAAFVLAAIGFSLHDKVSNLVGLGLALFMAVNAWNAVAST